MLKIEDLSYRYLSRHKFTLKKINLQLAEGEMLLLAGRSGCGKSTLIKAISGLLNNNDKGELRGKIYLENEDITNFSPEKIGILVGTVYQSPDDQLFAMTVADEVGFALENQGLEPDYIKEQVSETLRLVGLAGFENYSIHQLSGGQRQRLALASILITKPRLLILDEPVSQMNPQGVQDFLNLLLKLNREEKIAILMVEHRVNELAGYFKRLAVMQAGKIIYDGATENAWSLLDGKEDVGLREPQNVKLCRILELSELSSVHQKVVSLIKNECSLLEKEQATCKSCCAPSERIVEVQSLHYKYPGAAEETLHGLNFELCQKQITALMGFNGAGKSTLMNLLGGLAKVEEGSVNLAGAPIEKGLGKIGYLRQEPDLMLLADTVLEELCWKNKSITPSEVEALLVKLNLQDYARDFPLALSKGQRLRVVLGAMLAKKPQLLLLDEPTTGQDEQSLTEIKKLLLDYKNSGGCVFICTHDVELATEVADRVIVLSQGRILADAPTETVLSNRALLQAGGLAASSLLDICEEITVPPCITAEEVKCYVSTSTVGRH
ncbi:MAG: ATP-binding cassette domain-containing protein [Phascolarctobacterium sp.]|nr:ATP-binding cassette domain-containing protein [Phascolarctobacterium sp.]